MMTSHIAKVPLVRALAVRSYSSAQAVPISGTPTYEVETTTLGNKLVVASVDNGAAVSRVSVVIKAGSRYETSENSGAAHVLRVCAGLATLSSTQFGLQRKIEAAGAFLTAGHTRELVSYTLEGTRDAVGEALPYLDEIVTEQAFKPWEVADQTSRLRLELSFRPPQLRAVDLLHKAAFRRGLGNSLFIAKYGLGKISPETLQHYVASNFLPSRTAVVGVGFEHDTLVEYAKGLKLGEGAGKDAASPYKGGEIRNDKGGEYAYIGIAGPGAGICNTKELLAFAVLKRIVGGSPVVYEATSDHGLLSKSLGGKVKGVYSQGTFLYSYSDAGLFGVLIACQSKDAGVLVENAIKVLNSPTIDDKAVEKAKLRLKVSILTKGESPQYVLDSLGTQAAVKGSVKSPEEFVAEVESLTAADVQQAAQKLSSSGLSLAAYGNLRAVPYLDEIK